MILKEAPAFTPHCRFLAKDDGYLLTFFCEICECGYTPPTIHADSLQEARQLAEPDARLHFNWCHSCERWVCDEHFNENKMLCTECAPLVCSSCGAKVKKGDQFCTVCGIAQFELSEGRMEGNV